MGPSIRPSAPQSSRSPTARQSSSPSRHTHLKYGGGWSFFICPGCAKLAQKLYSIDGKPLCWRCCDKLNIRHRGKWGMGREERMRAADQSLDQLISKLETTEPLRLNGAPASWRGKAKLVYRSRRLTQRMRRRMVTLRLHQLASQQPTIAAASTSPAPSRPARRHSAIPELGQVWRATSTERLEQALDKAQCALLKALDSNDPRQRIIAARLMLKNQAARERGLDITDARTDQRRRNSATNKQRAGPYRGILKAKRPPAMGFAASFSRSWMTVTP